jgi:hypothetical protein
MRPMDLDEVCEYANSNIVHFHQRRIASLEELALANRTEGAACSGYLLRQDSHQLHEGWLSEGSRTEFLVPHQRERRPLYRHHRANWLSCQGA